MIGPRARAWETRRQRYGPKGNHGTYHRGTIDTDAVLQRRRLARLIALVHAHDLLTEGQIARVIDSHRVEVRELCDLGLDDLHAKPITGHWGANAMKRID